MPTIKFSVDGGLTFQEATEGVRIIYEGVDIPGEDGTGELHLNATHEGLISDLWTTREDPLDHNIGTSSQMIEDLVSDLVDDPVDAADQTVTLNLYIFDDAGDVVDDATATLTVEQLSDVVDHASQLILMRRGGQPVDSVLNELDEALTVAGVISAAAAPERTEIPSRPNKDDPRIFIEELGYNIHEDSDRPGLWVWTAPSDGCDSSFNSAGEALDGAWNDAVAQTLSIREITREEWGQMDADAQRVAVTQALSGELPRLIDLSVDTQMLWVEHVREANPDLSSAEAFRLADEEFAQSDDGTLPKPNESPEAPKG
jgi:hypothetical protein